MTNDTTSDDSPLPIFSWQDLPAMTHDLPGTGGTIRTTPEAFRVREIPAYLPSGSGSHYYLLVEKRERTTRDLIVALRDAGIPENRIGVAGLKDKVAVTEQWISVPWADHELAHRLDEMDGVTILDTSRHKNKLGVGHLFGNRFTITIHGVDATASQRAERILEALSQSGLPNYVGPQRFGRFGRNAVDGLRVLRGERVPGDRRLQRFFVSAVQSYVFNDLLAQRVREGSVTRLIDGDWARKVDTGGTFLVEDVARETPRAERFEITALLPLHGRKVRISEGKAGQRERDALARLGLAWSDLTGRRGDRRATRIPILEPSVEAAGGTAIQLAFTLPKGSYATTLLREVTGEPVDAPLDGE